MTDIREVFDSQIIQNHSSKNYEYAPSIGRNTSTIPLLNNSKQAEYVPLHGINAIMAIEMRRTYTSGSNYGHFDRTTLMSHDIGKKLVRVMVKCIERLPDYTELLKYNRGLNVHIASIVDSLFKKNQAVILANFDDASTQSLEKLAKDLLRQSINIIIDKVIYGTIEYGLPDMSFNHYGSSYAELIRSNKHAYRWHHINLRTQAFMVNRGSIYNIQRTYHNRELRILRPLMETVLHKDFVPYVYLCMIMKENPLPEVYEVWVDPEFDVVRSEFKNLRPHYRKHIKAPLVAAGIDIIPTDSILTSLYNTVSIPNEVKSIKEKKVWLSDLALEVKEHISFRQQLNMERQLTLVP